MSDRERFNITLEAGPRPGLAPPARRLAQLLKIALRGFDMKCVHVREEPQVDEGKRWQVGDD